MAPSPAQLELGIHRRNVESFSIELRLTPADPDGDVRVQVVDDVHFDFAELRRLANDPKAYGDVLTRGVFADQRARDLFLLAADEAEELRFRLFIGPNATDLQSLRWETLRDPRTPDGGWLVTSERILFSRYLSDAGYFARAHVKLRQRSDPRALVVIANPANGDQYGLAPIDVAGEVARASGVLTGIETTTLASGGTATLANVLDHLREGCDILYLVCHGAIRNRESQLYLEDKAGNVAVATGTALVEPLRKAQRVPRLAVLASCRSAGGEEATTDKIPAEFEQLVGPLLAGAGVPAVLAMQENIAIDTAGPFLSTFFSEFQRDEPIDRAVAIARGAVAAHEDSWVPILFMRLRTGRVSYAPGFREKFKRWPALIDSIKRHQCTPVLGPGVAETLLGSTREIATRWATDFGFPLDVNDRDELPRVAQYLEVDQKVQFLRNQFVDYLAQQLRDRYRPVIPPALLDNPAANILDLLAAVGKHRREENPSDPHKVLAELPFPVYVTTSPGNLLSEALLAAGKQPRTELCRWNDATKLDSVFDAEPDYEPSVSEPLVYHVYGHFRNPESFVLTEDNFFDYLIGLTRMDALIPEKVSAALTNGSLLFLGFEMTDWVFRVLFRTILNWGSAERRAQFAHVAVQLDPENDRVIYPDRAYTYLEEYFRGAAIDTYWGSVEDFIDELKRQTQGKLE